MISGKRSNSLLFRFVKTETADLLQQFQMVHFSDLRVEFEFRGHNRQCVSGKHQEEVEKEIAVHFRDLCSSDQPRPVGPLNQLMPLGGLETTCCGSGGQDGANLRRDKA